MILKILYFCITSFTVYFHLYFYNCKYCSHTALWWNSLLHEFDIIVKHFPIVYAGSVFVLFLYWLGILKKKFYAVVAHRLIVFHCGFSIVYWSYLLIRFPLVYGSRYAIFIVIHLILIILHFFVFAAKEKLKTSYIGILDL